MANGRECVRSSVGNGARGPLDPVTATLKGENVVSPLRRSARSRQCWLVVRGFEHRLSSRPAARPTLPHFKKLRNILLLIGGQISEITLDALNN